MKLIHSQDPRKQVIVSEIKKRTAANKVTRVREDKTHYYGDAMRGNVKFGYKKLGTCAIKKTELNVGEEDGIAV